MAETKYRAVVTGDIIRSSRLRPAQMAAVRSSLTGAVDSVKSWQRGLVAGRAEFFRGDGWQLLLTDPRFALRVAIFLRATLLAKGIADTRIAIGLGEGEVVPSRRIALLTGQAFVLSGHGLDNMTQYWRMTIELPEAAGDMADWIRVVGHLCDSIIGQWTKRQAQLACIAIHPSGPDYDAVARSLRPKISKQAVAKGLKGANWQVLRETIVQFESTSWRSVLQSREVRK